MLDVFLFRYDTEGDLGNGHFKCFFHGRLIIHTHRAIASVDVDERVDIIDEAEGLTGDLAVGLVFERYILSGIDLCLEVLRNLDIVIGDGEIKDVVNSFIRSRSIFHAAVFIDEGSYALTQLAIIIIAEHNSEVFIIYALFRCGTFVFVNDRRSGNDHGHGIDQHDDRRDHDKRKTEGSGTGRRGEPVA